jgi:Icc-related predicted phosphoesterase
MKRRHFLRLSQGIFGLSLVNLIHYGCAKPPTQAENQQNLPSEPIKPVSLNPAPQGLFAPQRGEVRIVVISDLNSSYGSTTYETEVIKAIALIPDWQPDLVLCGGDMIAGQKTALTKAQIQAMWSAFDEKILNPLVKDKIPFAFTVGNHDASGAISQGKLTYQQERDLASAYWQTSLNNLGLNFIDQGNFPFYYSFLNQDIFYLVWDASTHLISKEQLNWVTQQLQSPSAQQAKLRIVIGHLPLYGIAKKRDKSGEFLSDSEKLRSLLEKYRVHTYISGHQHAYYPGKKGNLELLHAGALGAGPRQLIQGNLPPQKTLTVVDIQPENALTTYTTYDMSTLKVIDIKTLPPFIDSPTGRILRKE